ncbi:MAG: hypothetical protein ACLFUJ_00830 [Phycisphaerae bacterium]
MKAFWKRIGIGLMTAIFAAGTVSTLSMAGCDDDDDPVEDAADELEEETD